MTAIEMLTSAIAGYVDSTTDSRLAKACDIVLKDLQDLQDPDSTREFSLASVLASVIVETAFSDSNIATSIAGGLNNGDLADVLNDAFTVFTDADPESDLATAFGILGDNESANEANISDAAGIASAIAEAAADESEAGLGLASALASLAPEELIRRVRDEVIGYKDEALDAKNVAQFFRGEAEEARSEARVARNEAIDFRNKAIQYEGEASDAKDAAQEAQTAAQTAREQAESDRDIANDARRGANDARDQAQIAAYEAFVAANAIKSSAADSGINDKTAKTIYNASIGGAAVSGPWVIARQMGWMQNNNSRALRVTDKIAHHMLLVSTVGLISTASLKL